MEEEGTALVEVNEKTGEIRPAVAPRPPVEVGGLAMFRMEDAQELRQRIDQYEEDYLRDEHYVWYCSWMDRGRRKRRGFDTRHAAEADAGAKLRAGGRVEQVKRAVAYDILKAPLNVSSEPAQEFDRDRPCRAHQGRHIVYVRGWRVTVPNGRYEVDRGTVATCEKLSDDESRLLWGDRQEHDPERTAERRGYVRAIKRLLGFGEPSPYAPQPSGARGGDSPRPAPSATAATNAPTPDDPNAAWAAFWATAKELQLDKAATHRIFRVEAHAGALAEYAAFRADQDRLPLPDVIQHMKDELRSA